MNHQITLLSALLVASSSFAAGAPGKPRPNLKPAADQHPGAKAPACKSCCSDRTHTCIAPQERSLAERESQRNAQRAQFDCSEGPPPMSFWPTGGRLYRDLFTTNFVDLDGDENSILSFDCSDRSYDGHKGNDTSIRSFAEQIAGVPVFAALDGVVTGTQDGQFDQHTSWVTGAQANYVILEHACGRKTYYWHLRRGSVCVDVGDSVAAGQQLGMIGSSGISTWPHLHFEVRDNGTPIEPYSGVCGPGNSAWEDQDDVTYDTYVSDAGFWHEPLDAYGWLPQPQPRTGHLTQDDDTLHLWMLVHNVQPGSVRQWEFLDASGAVISSAGPFDYTNTSELRKTQGRYYFGLASHIPNWGSVTGTWSLRLRIDGQIMFTMPFDVVEDRNDIGNRPPRPIGASLQPEQPEADDVIIASVHTGLINDDEDYDMVKYRYMWYVDGQLVRDVMSAGQSDVLARDKAASGDEVTCCIMPNDGQAYGDPVCSDVLVKVTGDINGDQWVDISDLLLIISDWGPCDGPFEPCHPDLDRDGFVNITDLLIVLGSWSR